MTLTLKLLGLTAALLLMSANYTAQDYDHGSWAACQ
jgi:hypothetical protein